MEEKNMQGNKFTISFHIPGTLAADITPVWKVDKDCQLLHVSANASNNSDATLRIGTTSDDDAYLAAGVIGDSNVPVEKGRVDFIGSEHPHIADGTALLLTLDFDGSSGTAAQNVTIVLMFAEG